MRAHLTFVLNGVVQRVDGISPTTTLLQWLRREKRLTGTKEGCAEGDCGACTVVVGTLSGERVRYETVNACIQFLPMLEGKSVTTVEGVAAAAGTLHPCQQAMVEMHASQCGFCTPGFVMSLYAMYLDHDTAPPTGEINDCLAGNLCRCTGYGPIVAAAQRMFALPRIPGAEARHLAERHSLESIQHAETICLEGNGRRVYAPTTEDQLAELHLTDPDATLVAGATDVGLWVTKQNRLLPVTISMGRIASMAEHSAAKPALRLGAGMSHTSVADAIGAHLPALAELWRRFAGAQVRNAGTIGGNIANGSPIGDLAPAFIALGATLHLRRGDQRRTLPLEDFFIAYGKQNRQPGEFITGIELPCGLPSDDFAIHKVSKRFDDDISAVCGAFNIHVEADHVTSARIAYGGMAVTPKRAKAVEAALVDQPWTRVTVDAAMPAFAADFAPISDARASAAYRLRVAQNLLLRTFLERTRPQTATRLVGPLAWNGA